MSAFSSSMPKDKKPFTYAPGGIDFSQLKSPRMAKRIAKHQEETPPTVPAPSSPSTNAMENPAPVRNQRSGSWSSGTPGAFNPTNSPLSGASGPKQLKQGQPVRRSISDLMATSNYNSAPLPALPVTASSSNHEIFNYNPYAPSRPMSLSPPVARSNSLPPTAEFQPTPVKQVLRKPQPPKQGLPPPHPQQGLPPSNHQQGPSSTYHQQGLPPPHPQQGLPQANYQQGLSPPHQQQGLPMPHQQQGLPPPHQQGLPPPHPPQGLPPHTQQGMTLSQPQQGLPPYHPGGNHPSHQIKASKDLIIEPSLNTTSVSQSYPSSNHVYQNSDKFLIPESVQSFNEMSKKETLSNNHNQDMSNNEFNNANNAHYQTQIQNNIQTSQPLPQMLNPPTLMHEALIPPPPPPPPPPMNLGVVGQYGKSGVPYIGPKPVKSSISLSSIRAGNTNFQEQEEEAKKQEQLMMQRIMEEKQQAERQQREEEARKQKQLMMQQLEQQKIIEAQQQAEHQQREEEEKKHKQVMMQQLEQQKIIEAQQQAERQQREEEEKKQKQILMQQLEHQKIIEAQQQVEYQQREQEAKKQNQFTMQQLEQQKILEALKEAEQREEEARKQKQLLMQQLERQKSLDDQQYLEHQKREEEAMKQQQLMMKQLECQRFIEEQQQEEHQQREEEERKQKQLMMQQLEQQKIIEVQQQAEHQRREEEERKQKQLMMQQLEQQKIIEVQQQAERQRREEEERKQKQLMMQQLEQQKIIEVQQQAERQQREEEESKQKQFMMQQLEQQKIIEAQQQAEQQLREEEEKKQNQLLMQRAEQQKLIERQQQVERQRREEEEKKQKELMMQQLEHQKIMKEQQQMEHQQKLQQQQLNLEQKNKQQNQQPIQQNQYHHNMESKLLQNEIADSPKSDFSNIINGFDHSLNEFEAQRNLMLTPPVTRDGDVKRSKSKELQIPSKSAHEQKTAETSRNVAPISSIDKSVTRGFEKPLLTSDAINNTMPPLHASHTNSKSKTESNKVKNIGNALKNLVMPSRNEDDELRLIERNGLQKKEENLSDPNLHQSVRLRPPSPGIVSKIQFNKMGSKPSSKFAKKKENEHSDNIGFDHQEYLHKRNTQMGNKQNGGFPNGNHDSESVSSTDTKVNSNGKLKTIDRFNSMENEDEIAGKIITGKMKLIEAQMKRDLEAKSIAPVNINIESGMSSKRSSFRSESTEPFCSKISGDGSFSEGELSTDETGIKLPIKMAPYEVMEEFEDAPEEFYLGISAYNIEHPIDKDDTVPPPEKINNTQIIELEGPFESEPILNTPQSHSPVNISIRKNLPNDMSNKRQGSESKAFENMRNMSNFSTPVQQKSSYQPFENKNTITDHFESMPSMFQQEPFMTPLTLDQLDCSFPNSFSSPFSMISPSFNMDAHNRLNNMIPVIEKNSNNGSNVAHRNENRGERSIPIQVENLQRNEKSGNCNSVDKTQFSPPPAFNKTPNSQPNVDRNHFTQTGAANISSSEPFVPTPPPPPQPKMSIPVSRQAEMMPPQMSGQAPKITPAMLQNQIASKRGQKDKGVQENSSNNSSQTSIPASHFSRQNSVKSPIDFQSSKTDADYRKNALNAIVGEISSHNSAQPSKVGGLRRGPNQSPSMRLLGRLHSVSNDEQE